jgi:hypothetical protein
MNGEEDLWLAARARMLPYVSAVFWQDFGIGGEDHDRAVNWMLDRVFRPEFMGATGRAVWRVMREEGGQHQTVARGLTRPAALEILNHLQGVGEQQFHWMEPWPNELADEPDDG